MSLVKEWKTLKLTKNVHSFKVSNTVFAFNQAMSLLLCIVFSLWSISLIFAFYNATSDKIFRIATTIAILMVMGIPWVIHLRFLKENMGWIEAIAWVAGTIFAIAWGIAQLFL